VSGGGPRWHPPAPADAPARAAALFTARYGVGPAGVWQAPGRVNLIGEHVDYAAGVCLPYALPHRTRAAVRPRTDGRLRVASTELDPPWAGELDAIGPGNPAGWPAYLAGAVWALRADGLLDGFGGADVLVDSDVPVGAGLSSSAALECALAVALADLAGGGSGEPGSALRDRLARACVRAENEVAGARTGGMDQAVALHARAGHCLRLDTADGTARPVPFDPAAHGLAVLVVNTNAPHRLVDGRYAARRAQVDRAAALLGLPGLGVAGSVDEAVRRLAALGERDAGLLRRVRHVITESARARAAAELLAAGRVAELGPLLTASHASLRDDYDLSCPELESAVGAATGAGALGARLVGGGFGGSAIALLPAGTEPAVAAAVRARAARAGLPEPGFLLAPAAGAAGRA
jgi:galactokinase